MVITAEFERLYNKSSKGGYTSHCQRPILYSRPLCFLENLGQCGLAGTIPEVPHEFLSMADLLVNVEGTTV